MKDGYQIIEPTALKAILGNPLHFEFAVAVLAWLIPQITTALAGYSTDISIEIIRVNYKGSYPALGVKYRNSKTPDLETVIDSTVSDLLATKPVADFVIAISSSTRSWIEITKQILT